MAVHDENYKWIRNITQKTDAFHLVQLNLDSSIIFKYMLLLQTKVVMTNTMNDISTAFCSHCLCDFPTILR